MKIPTVKASVRILLVLSISALSNAQTAISGDALAVAGETEIYGSLSEAFTAEHAGPDSSDQKTGHQLPGYVSGTILDQSGAVSAGAEVRLTHESQTPNREVRSGSNGQFVFSNVEPGSFRLTVTSPGFATREFSATLRPGEVYLVPPITLTVAAEVTEVSVKSSPLTPVQLADLQIQEQEKQRVLGFLPNFYVTYDREAIPLNTRQKFRLAGKTMADPFTFVGLAALAGVEQATDTFPGYGQGAEGYFKRFGATYADAFTGTFIGSAVLPSLLKQDPRYFYKGTGSVRSRLFYALASPVICKGDNMRWQPNYSNVGGAFASAGISYLYYPASDRNGAGLVVQNSLIRLGEVSFESVLQEFVIRRLTPHIRERASKTP